MVDDLPSTPMAAPAFRRDSLRDLAVSLAVDLERDRRQLTRGVGIGVGIGLAALTVALCIGVGGMGAYLIPVTFLATALGLSTAMLVLAVASAAVDGLVRVQWRRTALRHGLDDQLADQALEDARTLLYEEDRARLEAMCPTPRTSLLSEWGHGG